MINCCCMWYQREREKVRCLLPLPLTQEFSLIRACSTEVREEKAELLVKKTRKEWGAESGLKWGNSEYLSFHKRWRSEQRASSSRCSNTSKPNLTPSIFACVPPLMFHLLLPLTPLLSLSSLSSLLYPEALWSRHPLASLVSRFVLLWPRLI